MVPSRANNIGAGSDAAIAKLTQVIADVVGLAKPDGTPRKLLDISQSTALGWRPQIEFGSGYDNWYRTSRAPRRTYRPFPMASGEMDQPEFTALLTARQIYKFPDYALSSANLRRRYGIGGVRTAT